MVKNKDNKFEVKYLYIHKGLKTHSFKVVKAANVGGIHFNDVLGYSVQYLDQKCWPEAVRLLVV